jgi:hypothetical protein
LEVHLPSMLTKSNYEQNQTMNTKQNQTMSNRKYVHPEALVSVDWWPSI